MFLKVAPRMNLQHFQLQHILLYKNPFLLSVQSCAWTSSLLLENDFQIHRYLSSPKMSLKSLPSTQRNIGHVTKIIISPNITLFSVLRIATILACKKEARVLLGGYGWCSPHWMMCWRGVTCWWSFTYTGAPFSGLSSLALGTLARH